MATNSDVEELFNRYSKIEHEIKLLQEDRKLLLTEFKDRIDPKAFQAALRAAKSVSKLKPTERQDYDQALELLEKSLCLEHLE